MATLHNSGRQQPPPLPRRRFLVGEFSPKLGGWIILFVLALARVVMQTRVLSEALEFIN